MVTQTQNVDTKVKITARCKPKKFTYANSAKKWAHTRGMIDLKPYTAVEITLTPWGRNMRAPTIIVSESRSFDWMGNKILSVIKKQTKKIKKIENSGINFLNMLHLITHVLTNETINQWKYRLNYSCYMVSAEFWDAFILKYYSRFVINLMKYIAYFLCKFFYLLNRQSVCTFEL